MSKKDKTARQKNEVTSKTSEKHTKPSPQPLNERELTTISKAIADPKRLAVLRTIARGDSSCSDLKDCLKISAATLSHHMKELQNAGLIQTSREGRFLKAKLERKLWKSYIGELKAIGN